jgi:hypothetical protein
VFWYYFQFLVKSMMVVALRIGTKKMSAGLELANCMQSAMSKAGSVYVVAGMSDDGGKAETRVTLEAIDLTAIEEGAIRPCYIYVPETITEFRDFRFDLNGAFRTEFMWTCGMHNFCRIFVDFEENIFGDPGLEKDVTLAHSTVILPELLYEQLV